MIACDLFRLARDGEGLCRGGVVLDPRSLCGRDDDGCVSRKCVKGVSMRSVNQGSV